MSQQRLFEVPEEALKWPPGFRYKADFITLEEEEEFLREFKRTTFKNFMWEGYESKRRIGSFNRKSGYPEFFKPIVKRVAAFAGILPSQIDYALISEYSPGTQIGWHRDKGGYAKVIGISLGSIATFRLRKLSNIKNKNKWPRFNITAEPRSLYIMSGETMFSWQHSIPPIPDLRWSLTMRTVEK